MCVFIYIHIYIYIYIYIYNLSFLKYEYMYAYKNTTPHANVYIYIYTFVYIYIYIYTNFIKHNRHFVSIYILLDPFVFCINYKSDVFFVFAYYNYVRASLPLRIIAFAFKWVSMNSVSS